MCNTKFVSLFGLGGLTPGAKYTKADMTCYPPRSTILPNFITLHRPTPETSVIKNLQTNTETVNDISTACLLACGVITQTDRQTDIESHGDRDKETNVNVCTQADRRGSQIVIR